MVFLPLLRLGKSVSKKVFFFPDGFRQLFRDKWVTLKASPKRKKGGSLWECESV